MKNRFLICILLFILLIILYYFFRVRVIEKFEDKFDDFEKYEEIYDDQFVNLYEIIYRDFTDIDYDTKVVYKKTINGDETPKFLVGGSGVGKLCKAIKDKYKDVIGVDISENMLKMSQKLYPNVKFVRGNLVKTNIFKEKEFTHIYIDERTLHYNNLDDIEKIIKNCFFWLKEESYLIVPIYDPDELQLASRYYSSKYIDDKGYVHGFTYLNDFSHDCYYIKEDGENDTFNYYDKVIFDTGDKRIKKTTFNIPSKEKIYDIILNNGFDVLYIENIRIQIVGGYQLAIFKKKKQTITVEELEKKNIRK
jgi:ubiquinone/menaquinone biosynthesis C-methylase UbiE